MERKITALIMAIIFTSIFVSQNTMAEELPLVLSPMHQPLGNLVEKSLPSSVLVSDSYVIRAPHLRSMFAKKRRVCLGSRFFYIGEGIFELSTGKYIGNLNIPVMESESSVVVNPVLGTGVCIKNKVLYRFDENSNTINDLGALPESVLLDKNSKTSKVDQWSALLVSKDKIWLQAITHSPDQKRLQYILLSIPDSKPISSNTVIHRISQRPFVAINRNLPVFRTQIQYEPEPLNSELTYSRRILCLDYRNGKLNERQVPNCFSMWYAEGLNKFIVLKAEFISEIDVEPGEPLGFSVTASFLDDSLRESVLDYTFPIIKIINPFMFPSRPKKHITILNEMWDSIEALFEGSCTGRNGFIMWMKDSYFRFTLEDGKMQILTRHIDKPVLAASSDEILIDDSGVVELIDPFLLKRIESCKDEHQEETRIAALGGRYPTLVAYAFPHGIVFIQDSVGRLSAYSIDTFKLLKDLGVVNAAVMSYSWRLDRILLLVYKNDERNYIEIDPVFHVQNDDICSFNSFPLSDDIEEELFMSDSYEAPLDYLEFLKALERFPRIIGFSANTKTLFYTLKDPGENVESLYSFDGKLTCVLLEVKGRIIGLTGADNSRIIVKDGKNFFLHWSDAKTRIVLPKDYKEIKYAFANKLILERKNYGYAVLDLKERILSVELDGNADDGYSYFAGTPVFMSLLKKGMRVVRMNDAEFIQIYNLKDITMGKDDGNMRFIDTLLN